MPSICLLSCPTRAAFRAVMLIGFISLLAPLAFAKDWTKWCGSDGKNMVADETGIPATFYPGDKDPGGAGFKIETAKNVQWLAHIGAWTVASPAVADGRIFIGSVENRKGVFKCLDAKTGKMIWQWIEGPRIVPQKIAGRPFAFYQWQGNLGVCSTATVEDGRVYFVSHRCEVVCLAAEGDSKKIKAHEAQPAPLKPNQADEADTSKVIWKYDMYGLGSRPANVSNCSVLIHGDFIYVCTSNGVDRQPGVAQHDELRAVPAPECPSLIVLEKKTGRLVAMDDQKIAAGPRMLHGQYSAPSLGVVGGKTLIFYGGGDGILYAFEALDKIPERPVTLKLAWKCDCVPQEYQEAWKSSGRDWMLHYCQGDKRRADSTNKKNDGTWTGMLEIIATPVFYNGLVYLAIGRDPDHGRGRGGILCIDPTGHGDITKTGKRWVYQGLDRTISTVSIADGLLYIADMAGRLHCLDPETGKPIWMHETKAEVWGSTMVVDGKIFLPTHKGLFVFKAGREDKQLGKIDLGSQVYATPVPVNGTLYVTSRNYLWAVKK